MTLSNSQYDAVMRHYDAIREKNHYLQTERTERVYAQIPEIRSLDDETAVRSLDAAKLRILDPSHDLSGYKAEMQRIRERKSSLLRSAGYPDNYLELPFDCPDCRDTGFIDGRHCTCFDRAAAETIYGFSALKMILKSENFEHFSFNWYSDKIEDSSSGRSPYQDAKIAFEVARAFSGKIGTAGNNLYIYGNTGVGKTFLTHCIAEDLLARGNSVLYFSAAELFDLLADASFSKDRNAGAVRGLIDDCDLLIIDDLGTEYTNAYSTTEIFRLINDRARSLRSTIISTNLTIRDLQDKYSERISSRIVSDYQILRLTGGDIRLMKKLQGE